MRSAIGMSRLPTNGTVLLVESSRKAARACACCRRSRARESASCDPPGFDPCLCRGGDRLACRRALSPTLPTAVLGEIADQPVHRVEIRAIDQLTADALLRNEPRTL